MNMFDDLADPLGTPAGDAMGTVLARARRRRAAHRSAATLAALVAVVTIAASANALIGSRSSAVRVLSSTTTVPAPTPTTTPAPTSTTTAPTSTTTAPTSTTTTIVSLGGQVGTLHFGVSTEADVRAALGPPDGSVEGDFGMTQLPKYLALGYECLNTKRADRFKLAAWTIDAPPYCRTAYYINVNTRTLVGFRTRSPEYATTHGTTVGMTEAEAQRREGQPSIAGCFTAIRLGDFWASPPGPFGIFLFVGTLPTDRVDEIDAESNANQVGVLFC